MQPAEPISQESIDIAEQIRSGEFFRESQRMYDFAVHDPMAERYLYLLITSLAVLVFFIAFIAMQGLYPLRQSVPFIVSSNDIVEELPSIKSLLAYKGEGAEDALLRFVVENYVRLREEYNIETFDRNVNGVKSQSSEEVYQAFQRQIDPRNPESPITLYQRHSHRKISILSSKRLKDGSSMEVVFESSIEGKNEIKKARWQANIAFHYIGVTIDQDTAKLTSSEFLVTQYSVKRFQDIK